VRSVEATPTKEEPMTAEKQEVVKSDIESQLLPVTEKTEVKAIETPSDKMVIKSEAKVEQPKVEVKPTEEPKVEETKVEPAKVEVKPTEVAKVEVKEMKTEQPKMKVKGKLKPEPIKIETIKVESEKGPTTVDVPSFAVPEPRKKYKPYGEKGPDVYYSEEYDQYIIKEGDNRTVVEKGSGKYEEIDKNINNITRKIKESIEDCPESKKGCPKNLRAVSTYFANKYYLGQENEFGDKFDEKINKAKIIDDEGALANFIDKAYDGRSVKWIENEDYYDNNRYGGYYYTAEEPPKSKRFSVYKPYGNENTSIIFDNNTEAILKETDDKILSEDKKPLTTWVKISPDESEYKELKSIIEGINYKKEKGSKNTYVAPTISTGVPTSEWSQVKEVPAPSDKMVIKSETKAEPKPVEEVKGIPSYDDLGIEKGTNLLTNTPYYLPKGMKYKEMSPSEIISTVVDENGFVSRNGIKLNRNTSIRYPDPPGTVFKKEKVGDRELYSSYDKSNGKWYIYDANSNKDNWTEVKTGPIKTLLNSKFPDKENKEKIDKVTEDERKLIDNTRNSVYVNVYIPYLLKNEDKLSDEESLKLQKMIEGIAHFKTIEAHFKEEPFTGSLEDYLEKKEKIRNISDTREMPKIEDITDKKHLQIINDIVARTDNENGYFKQFFESKSYPTENFSYSELENRKSNNELDLYKSILGTVFYDKNKDEFYWTEYDKKRIAREKYNHVYEGDKLDFDEKSKLPYLVIKKGTPDYDKIKSSLSKYNK
jgi:hypothetical protein